MNETNPNPDPLDALFAAARAKRPDTSRAEYGFETRLMANLRERQEPALDPFALWSKVTWRMAPIFATGVVALAIWQADLATDASDDAVAAGLNAGSEEVFGS